MTRWIKEVEKKFDEIYEVIAYDAIYGVTIWDMKRGCEDRAEELREEMRKAYSGRKNIFAYERAIGVDYEFPFGEVRD